MQRVIVSVRHTFRKIRVRDIVGQDVGGDLRRTGKNMRFN